MRTRLINRGLFVGGFLIGCAAESNRRQAQHTTTDSAGVVVVTSNQPQLTGRDAYRIDSVPVFDIDGTEGHRPGFAGAVNLTHIRNGRIVVADLSAKQLYLLGSDGRLISVVGGPGNGPGEYGAINFIGALPHDSIAVSDPVLNRLTVLDSNGSVGRTANLPEAGPGTPLAINGTFEDGLLLATTFYPVRWHPRSGVQRDTMPMVTLQPDVAILSSLGNFPGPDGIVVIEPGQTIRTGRLPFGRVTRQTIVDTFVAIGVGDRYEITVYTRDGRVVRAIRWNHAPIPVTAADVEAFTKNRLATVTADPEIQSQVARSIRDAPMPRFMPPYDLMLTRSNGELWVRAYSDPHARDRPANWSVFDRAGVWRTDVTLPAGVEPKWIGDDTILATWQDHNDLYHVRLYHLHAGG